MNEKLKRYCVICGHIFHINTKKISVKKGMRKNFSVTCCTKCSKKYQKQQEKIWKAKNE